MDMPDKRNYQRELEILLQELGEKSEADGCGTDGQAARFSYGARADRAEMGVPRLLLHSCCAPCSSYVLEYLSDYFSITDFFYNPNIEPEAEYRHRELELSRLIGQMHPKHAISFVRGNYDPAHFHEAVRGLEQIPEGGARCFACYRLRMEEAARLAAEGGYNYFTTTLSISPLKNAAKINEIGEDLERKYGVKHLPSDFKKKGGYQRSIMLSRMYGLYRQDYCGCVYSRAEREREKQRRLQGTGQEREL